MTHLIANNIAHFFCKKGIISNSDVDSYAYGFELILISSINWGAILLIMFCNKMYIETLLYIISFLSLRHHTGGYHARTHLHCFILSLVTYIFTLTLCRIELFLPCVIINSLSILSSLIIIYKYAPLIHENHPIVQVNLIHHRRVSLLLSAATSALSLLFTAIAQYSLSIVLSLSLFQVSISLLVGIYIQKRKEVQL